MSGREPQILEGLVAGQPKKLLAFELGISPRTVKIYQANLITQMQARQFVRPRMALIAGLLPDRL